MKKILKSLLFILILFLLVESASYFFVPNNKGKFSFFKLSKYDILEEKENTIDLIALGDSLVYSSFSPMEMWHNFGYTSFDCADPGQVIPDAYDYIKEVVKKQQPKILLMEANLLYRDPKLSPWNNKMTNAIKNYFPIFEHHNNWKKYILEGFRGDWINVYKGYKYITKTKPATKKDYMKYSEKVGVFPKGNLDYFLKIKDICEQNNIKLILISFPTQKAWSYKKHMGIVKLSNKYNIDFIDLNTKEDLNIDWEKETKDGGGHLNYLGAKRVTKYIGDYLKTFNILEDHRQDEQYKNWHKAYEIYKKSSID